MLVFITIIYWIANLESILQIRNMSDQNAALAKKATEVKTPTQKELRRLQDRMRKRNKGKRTNKGAGNKTSGDISTKTSFISPPFMSSSSVKTVTCIEVSRDENILTVQSGEDQSYTRKIDVVNPNIHLDHNGMSGSSAPILAATEDSLSHPMDNESEQMHADSFGVKVSDNQSLEDSLPVIKHAGSYGEGLPYAPENWPSLGDVWTWRVGKRYTLAGFWQDRSVHPPDCLQSSMGNKMGFNSRVALERYIQNTFPDADVDAFFASFVWKIPCTDAARDNTQIVNASGSPNIIKSNGNSKSALAVRPGGCKASNEMCCVNLKTSSSLNPATCYICCSEPNFCRYCCCILCSKTIDSIYDGCKFIKCEAPVDEKFICGHVAHIECGLRAHLAGKVGGNIDLDAQYYCRCCDNKTDLLLHVDKIIKVCESIDNRDDTRKILNLGLSILRGSEKEKAKKLRNHIAISIGKLHHGASCDEKWKKKSEVLEPEQGIMEIELHGHNEEQNPIASQSSKKRRRGPTTRMKYKTQEPKYIGWSDNGKPIGKWVKSYNAYVGDIARSKIDINIKNWKDVCQGLKNTIWEDVKIEYHIDDKMKGTVLKIVCDRWRDFKAKLVSGWITKTRKLPEDHKEPYVFYDGITQAQWKKFKKNCETEEFKEISEKARKSRSYNEHPHYLGQAGYAGKKAKWIAEGHNSSTTLPSGPILDRSIDWILARSKKGADGNYAIPNEKTKIVADKVNDWREKAIKGTWVPNRHDDILNRALEKKEHSGRVRGIGGTVSIKDVFGEVEKRKGPSGVIPVDELHLISQEIEAKVSQRVRQETLAEVESIMDAMVEQKIVNILNRMGMQMPTDMKVDKTPSVGHRNSCQSIHLDKLQSANETQEMDPYAELQEPTKCLLAVNLDSKIVVVGRGMVHPASRLGDQCHNQQILADHVKVGIDAVESSYEGTLLPVSTKHHSTIGEAVGSFAQWPKNLVLLRDNDMATPIASKDKVKECVAKGPKSQPNKSLINSNNKKVMNTMTNESEKRNTIVDEEILRALTDECRNFHDLIVQAPSDYIVINAIQVNKNLFTYDEDFEIHITMDDIIQFLSMTWLNVSWLQIYIMWLNHMCNDLEVETIGFMCPHKLSQVRKYPDATNTYISNAWRASQSKRLLLAPHYEGKHCLLLVFHIEKNEVYVFDPQAERKRKLEIKPQVNVTFKTYRAYNGKSRGTILKWKTVKCRQQSGSTDCVYYVMRYMYEIVKNHHQSIDLHEDFVQDGSYSQQEVDEVRDNLANYIMHNWMW